jgi:hypothetical protein
VLGLGPAHFYAVFGTLLQIALCFAVLMLINRRLQRSLQPLAEARVYAAKMVVGQLDVIAPASLTRGDEDNDELSEMFASENVNSPKN